MKAQLFVMQFEPPPHEGCIHPKIIQCEARWSWWVGQRSDEPPSVIHFSINANGICDNYRVGENVIIEARYQPLRHDKIRVETTTIRLPNGDEFGIVPFDTEEAL